MGSLIGDPLVDVICIVIHVHQPFWRAFPIYVDTQMSRRHNRYMSCFDCIDTIDLAERWRIGRLHCHVLEFEHCDDSTLGSREDSDVYSPNILCWFAN